MSFSHSWEKHGLRSEEKPACSQFLLLVVSKEKGGWETSKAQINWVSSGDEQRIQEITSLKRSLYRC